MSRIPNIWDFQTKKIQVHLYICTPYFDAIVYYYAMVYRNICDSDHGILVTTQ